MILNATNISKSFGSNEIIKSATFLINEHEKAAIVGVNGAGKTTLLKILTGEEQADGGSVTLAKDAKLGYLRQINNVDSTLSIIDELYTVIEPILDMEKRILTMQNEMRHLTGEKLEKLYSSYTALTHNYELMDGYAAKSKVAGILKGLGFEEADFDRKINTLSGGQKTRVFLAKLLLEEPDIILLDEPTNHLDAESVLWLEQHLQQYAGTVIAVTHDRYFLDNVAGWILELDRGEGIPWKGNYSSWLDQKAKRLAQEQKAETKRQKVLERELEWVRQGAKGRQAKQKARLQNYDRLLSEDQKQLEEKLEIYIPNGPRLGTNVIEARHVSKAFGDKLLYDDLNFVLPQAGIVGVIGPNGAGKSTIFRMIMGEEKPDSGEFLVGDTVKIAYVDQTHKNIDPEKSIWENFSDGQDLILMGGRQVNSRAYLSRFNFSGSDQNKKVATLSGGERNRLHLAMTLKEEGNVLLLDEPTNDLDVNTLRALEEGLENFAGCAVVISHDRWFLDRICTHILAFEGDSQVYFFEGSFSEYEENKKKRLGKEVTPTRIKYKKLTR